MAVKEGRYVGIDPGKRTREMAVITRNGKFKVNGQGDAEPEEKVTRFSGRTAAEGWLKLYEKLKAGDKAALEAGNMAFIMAKELDKIAGCQVRVLNPHNLAVIYATDRKTDKEDALKLAHPVTDRPDSRLPAVEVSGDEETERRKPVSSYRREQKARTQGINRLHAAFVHTGITTVVKKDLMTGEAGREAVEQLSGTERREADHLVKCLELHEERITALKQETAKGDEQIEQLETVPGVGIMTAFAFCAFVNAKRFENGAQVANCLGLAPRVYSGSTQKYLAPVIVNSSLKQIAERGGVA